MKSLSRSGLLATPWTAAYQAPLSMDFPGKSTGVGCHCLLRYINYHVYTSRWADCGTSRQHSTPTLCDTLVCVQLGPFSSSCLSLFPPEVQRTARSQCLVSLTVSAQRLWSRQNVLSFHQSFFHLIKFFTKWHSIANKGTSLVLQWLRIHLPMQGTWVRSLVWEDSTSHRAAEPMNHNY